jgi:hypothetical protein
MYPQPPPNIPTTEAAPEPPPSDPRPPGDDGPVPPPPGGRRWFAVGAVVLGVLGCVLPFTPLNPAGVRAYVTLAIGLLGLTVGIAGLLGRRRGKELAGTGALLCLVALVVATVGLVNARPVTPAKDGPGDHTEAILREDLDVRLGEWRQEPETETVWLPVTVHNKGSDRASFTVTFEFEHLSSGNTCDARVYVSDLPAGSSYREEIRSCNGKTTTQEIGLRVAAVSMSR